MNCLGHFGYMQITFRQILTMEQKSSLQEKNLFLLDTKQMRMDSLLHPLNLNRS